MDPLAEGLRVSAVGLTLVFAALGMLVLLLSVLQWVSNWHLAAGQRRSVATSDDIERASEQELAEVAAVAVALMTAQAARERDRSLGNLLQQPASSWWNRGGTPG